jgi:preprotein translocase subunit YajC
MLKRIRSWFKHLSKAGKIGTVGAGLFCLLIVSSAIAKSGSQTPPESGPNPHTPACEASTTFTTEPQAIPFTTTKVDDANLEKGKTVVTTTGISGETTITKEVTSYVPDNCKPASTKTVKEETTKQPVTEVVSVGTKVCSPYYSPCVPNVSYDLDCSDIGMRVSVSGGDPYRLDADHDGVGCESY